jgi:hypothetical protein
LCLAMAGAAAAVPCRSWLGRASGSAITATLALIACYSIGCLRLTYFKEWKWDEAVTGAENPGGARPGGALLAREDKGQAKACPTNIMCGIGGACFSLPEPQGTACLPLSCRAPEPGIFADRL